MLFPSDNGKQLIQSIRDSSSTIFGASDAAYKNNQSIHAWVISSGKVSDLENPLLHILGSGQVHGHPQYLSSSRGELQGIMAIAVILKLLSEFYTISCKVSSVCDNSGVIQKC